MIGQQISGIHLVIQALDLAEMIMRNELKHNLKNCKSDKKFKIALLFASKHDWQKLVNIHTCTSIKRWASIHETVSLLRDNVK